MSILSRYISKCWLGQGARCNVQIASRGVFSGEEWRKGGGGGSADFLKKESEWGDEVIRFREKKIKLNDFLLFLPTAPSKKIFQGGFLIILPLISKRKSAYDPANKNYHYKKKIYLGYWRARGWGGREENHWVKDRPKFRFSY